MRLQKYSGINVRRTKAIAFVLSGIFAALGGILLASKLNTEVLLLTAIPLHLKLIVV